MKMNGRRLMLSELSLGTPFSLSNIIELTN